MNFACCISPGVRPVGGRQACRNKGRRLQTAAGNPIGGNSQDPLARDAVKRLSKLFYQEPEELQDSGAAVAGHRHAGVLPDLPLLLSEWVLVPGSQAILHVHAPHDVHMINAVFARHKQQQQQQQQQVVPNYPLPVFGFLYAPSGKHAATGSERSTRDGANASSGYPHTADKGAPNLAGLRNGSAGGGAEGIGARKGSSVSSSGPQVQGSLCPSLQSRVVSLPHDQRCGCILEITRAVKLRDGRFLLLVTALSRMHVLLTTQVLPFVRANVVLWPDEEEVKAAHVTFGLTAALQSANDLAKKAAGSSRVQTSTSSRVQAPVGSRVLQPADSATKASRFYDYNSSQEGIADVEKSEARYVGEAAQAVGACDTHREGLASNNAWAAAPLPGHDAMPLAAPESAPAPDMIQQAALQEGSREAFGEVCAIGDEACHALWQHAASEAARAAAIAAAAEWHIYEFCVPRLHRWHEPQYEDPSVLGASTSSLVTSLVDMGVVDIISLPGGGAVQGSWTGLQAVSEAAQARAEAAARGAALSVLYNTSAPHSFEQPNMTDGAELVGRIQQDASMAFEDELLVLEQKIWEALDTLVFLSQTVSQRAIALPMGLLQLRPTITEDQAQQDSQQQQQQQQQPEWLHQHEHYRAASDGLDVCAELAWPAQRRTQRLSYALMCILLDPADTAGRQQFLGTRSAAGRLRVCLQLLQSMSEGLAAKRSVLNLIGEIEGKAKERI